MSVVVITLPLPVYSPINPLVAGFSRAPLRQIKLCLWVCSVALKAGGYGLSPRGLNCCWQILSRLSENAIR